MPQLIDQFLLYRIRTKRDAEAFGRLYDRYAAAIYRFVFHKVSSPEKAEDITSETFLKSWEYLLNNAEVRNVRALFYQVARNRVIDSYRKKTVAAFSIDEAVTSSPDDASTEVEGGVELGQRDVSDHSRGKDRIEAQADAALLLKRMSGLKEDFQDVLTLRLVEGLGFAEIAKILDKTTGNVRVMFHRALKALEELK